MFDVGRSQAMIWRKTRVIWATLVLGVVTSCEEPQLCTAIGCSYPLSVSVESEAWAPGEYVVTISESGRTFECRFERGAGGAGGQAGAEGQDDVAGLVRRCTQVAGDPAETWDAPEFWGDEDVVIDIMHAAKEVSISVRRDGATLLDTELTPSYRRSYPNGPDCGECLNATETLTLPDERP